ncbi:FAD binding domain-containing protein [Aspergillus egyptiacus]|nr:FAD binding domain-containing protein [Aspergillus egyptiacus]
MGSIGEDKSHVDVLIVGAGPAGLMAATWMARCGIKTRIVDKRGTKVFNGQADGLQCRTLEILDSFGFGDRAWKEANHMLEICLWNPDSKGVLNRSARIADTIPGISRFQQVVLHQGRIERFFLDFISSCSDIQVERGVMPTKIEIDESLVESPDAYPITVNLRHLSEAEATPKQTGTAVNGSAVQDGLFRSNLAADDTEDLLKASALDAKANTEEVVKAKYMLGADGAHSWVRQQLGFALEGESTDYIWGVLDIVPITDFPDIRMRCAIHSANSGSVMVIPRENKLVRLYIQLTTTEYNGGKRADRSKINPDVILQAAQKIMAPYKISYRRLDWWTAYQIGQRVGTNFSAHERVFLAGDAVHTHSPKAGQGMNVSMQDSYNLGWKIANVVKGFTNRSILKTYESERRKIAQDLIAFDHRFSRLFSGRPARDIMDEEGISMDEFKEAFEKGNMFASGIAVDYGSSVIVAKEKESNPVISKPELAPEIKLGKRIPSVKVLSQADARPWHLQERLPSNGSWRVLVLAGDVTKAAQKEKIEKLGAALSDKNSFLRRYTPAGARYDSVIEVLTVHAAPRHAVDIFDFPEVFRPYDEIDGWDYERIYVDDMSYHEGHGKLYETFGVDPEKGCVVVLRPDQYVSYIGPLEDYNSLDQFFAGFMVKQSA